MNRHGWKARLIGLVLAAVMLAGAFPAQALPVQAAQVIQNEDLTLWLPAAADTLGDMAEYCETDASVMTLRYIQYLDAEGRELSDGHRFTVGEDITIMFWLEPAAGYAFDGTSRVNVHRLIAGQRPGGYMMTPADGVDAGTGRFELNWTVPFRDVLEFDAFYYPDIQLCSRMGFIQGWDDGTYRPLNTCNRAAIVTFLWRLAGKPDADGPHPVSFSDMTGNSEFDNAIRWAASYGIATGYSDGTFRPWNPCNRAAILTFFWRMSNSPMDYQGYPSPFSDVDKDNPFYAALMWAYHEHLVTGYNDGTLRPWATCNRLAAACFVNRYFIYHPLVG